MGESKLTTNNPAEEAITHLQNRIRQLGEGLDLEAAIMLCLIVKRDKNPNKAEKDPSTQELSLELLGTAKYTTEAGKTITFVEDSGIHIPAKQYVASIAFMSPKEAFSADPRYTTGQLLRREDQVWGTTYAPYQQVVDAWQALNAAIAEIEKNEIDIKALCPEAQTDIKGPVSVSVANVGGYFNRFTHLPDTHLPENYHSGRRIITGANPDIIFMPGNAIITPFSRRIFS